MENATEALKMAFGIMMFVLALSLAISSFSSATHGVDSIVTLRDRETQYTYVTPASNSNRIVGVETVVPTLYKAYKENFRVQFLDRNGTTPLALYYQTDSFGNRIQGNPTINYIDLENEIIATPSEAIEHLNILLNKQPAITNKYYKQFMADKTQGLYKYLQDKRFEEVLGEYYQEDALGTQTTDVLDINKTKKRVITYILQ